jgi:hypothetical protein
MFARDDQTYLIKETRTYDFLNVTGSSTIEMDSMNMVSSYMWRFRRSDVNLRNEWTNYSNWAYEGQLPVPPDSSGANANFASGLNAQGPHPPYGIYFYKCLHPENAKDILIDLAIVMDGEYREDLLSAGVWNLVEKYTRTTGNAKDGLYCYNFCLNSNQREYQPSGAMNMNKYKKIQFELNTIQPPRNTNTPFDVASLVNGNSIFLDDNTILVVKTLNIGNQYASAITSAINNNQPLDVNGRSRPGISASANDDGTGSVELIKKHSYLT